MGQNFQGQPETPILTSAFSRGLATGLRNGELNRGDHKFLRHVANLPSHFIAHIAHDSKPPVKAQPYRWSDFDI